MNSEVSFLTHCARAPCRYLDVQHMCIVPCMHFTLKEMRDPVIYVLNIGMITRKDSATVWFRTQGDVLGLGIAFLFVH